VAFFRKKQQYRRDNTHPLYNRVHRLLDGTSEKIKEGDTILDSTKKFVMGTVTSFKREPMIMSEKDFQTGNTVSAEIPGRETVLIELVCNCSASDAQITAESGYVIRVGAEATAAGPGYAGKVYRRINRRGVGRRENHWMNTGEYLGRIASLICWLSLSF
jgi:hypothetical protein